MDRRHFEMGELVIINSPAYDCEKKLALYIREKEYPSALHLLYIQNAKPNIVSLYAFEFDHV